MINDGQNFLTTHWQLTTFPGLAVVVVGLVALADRRRARRPDQAGSVDRAELSWGQVGPGGPGAEPMLEVSDLHVEIASRRGTVRAVDGVSLEVAGGEALGLVGESGSGKSMTLRAMLGVLPPEARITSGEILLDGVDLVAAAPTPT